MSEKKFLFVGTSKENHISSIFWSNIINNGLSLDFDKDKVVINTKYILNNTSGLPKVYNKILKDERRNYDYIVFMHCDILFNNFVEFVKEVLKNDHPIMGLAGAVKFDKFGTHPIAWNTMSTFHAGEVWHRTHGTLHKTKYGDNSTKKLYESYFPVRAIDGLCIILGKEALTNEELVFDEKFDFHFYDLDFCMTANKLGIKIGIIHAPVIHYSPGFGILSKEYKVVEKKFSEKWNISENIVDYESCSSVNTTNS